MQMDNATGAHGPARAESRTGIRCARLIHSPLSAADRRQARAARAARRSLAHELASYTSPADRSDLAAILDRHSEQETADIRRILSGRGDG